MAVVAAALLGIFLPQACAQFNLNIVHWGDLHGRMVPSTGRGAVPCADETDTNCYGGLARIASVCKLQKDASPTSLCLDAGDSFSGTYWPEVDTDSTYLEQMNTFVDAYVVGNHDFDKGVDYLANFIENATFPVLGACNLDLSAEPRLSGKIQKWATFELNGTNVAILGFANVDQAPEMEAITGGIKFFGPTDSQGLVACINEFKFQNPGPWVIGVLSHAGITGDLQLIRSVNSVQRDISFVVGGHSHEAFFEAKRGRCLATFFNATTGQTLCDEKTRETSRYEYPADAPSGAGLIKLLHAGWAGKYVGQALLQYNANLILTQAVGSMQPAGLFFDDALSGFQVDGDAQVTQALAADKAALAAYKAEPIAVMPVALERVEPLIFRDEQLAGGVICSALMWNARNLGFVGTAEEPLVCVQNAQTIRRSLPAGPVSITDIENFLPPTEGLTMTIVEIERASLISALENSVSTLNNAAMEVADDRFLHIGGGLQFTYDVTGQPYRFNRTSGELLSAGSRVTGVTYECGDLPTGTVRVVLNSQLAEGVQDYVGLKNGETVLDYGPLLSEALSMYLDAAAPQDGEVPAAVVNIPAQINAPPPCESTTAWSTVPAAPYVLQPLPGVAAADAPAPVGDEVPPPVEAPPAANATNTTPAATAPPPPTAGAGTTPAATSPPATATPSANTTGATPADTASDTGDTATPAEEVAEDAGSATAVGSAVALAAAAAVAVAILVG
eukprot:jgi/Ulvmu1/5479/UM023_0015.1